jgi:hypothetical protein
MGVRAAAANVLSTSERSCTCVSFYEVRPGNRETGTFTFYSLQYVAVAPTSNQHGLSGGHGSSGFVVSYGDCDGLSTLNSLICDRFQTFS